MAGRREVAEVAERASKWIAMHSWEMYNSNQTCPKLRKDDDDDDQDPDVKKLRAGLTSLSSQLCLLSHLSVGQARS
jgi:hypothetical protein